MFAVITKDSTKPPPGIVFALQSLTQIAPPQKELYKLKGDGRSYSLMLLLHPVGTIAFMSPSRTSSDTDRLRASLLLVDACNQHL